MSLQTLFKIGKTSGRGLVGSFFGKEQTSPAQVIQLSEEERKKRAISFLGAEEYGYPYQGDDAPNILTPEPLVQTTTSFVPQQTEVPEIIEAPRGQVVRGLGNIVLEIERINRNITNIQDALINSAAIEKKYREQIIKDKQGLIGERDKLRSQRRASRRRESLFGRMYKATGIPGAVQGAGAGLLEAGIYTTIFGVMNFMKDLTEGIDKFINGVREKLGLPVEEDVGPLGLPPSGAKLPELPPTNTIPGQQYGDPRDDDGDGKPDRKHAGVDFDIDKNDYFYSRLGGVVTKVGKASGYGNYVDIYNAQYNVTERIAEGRKVLPGIEEGTAVVAGQPIVQGESSTGVIHYEIREGKKTTFGFAGTKDPLKFLRDITPPEPKEKSKEPIKTPSGGPETEVPPETKTSPVGPQSFAPPVRPKSMDVASLGPTPREPIVIDARTQKKLPQPPKSDVFSKQAEVAVLEPRLLNSGHESMFA